MARGGRREGAGRPWGSRDRVKRRSASIAEIATRDALAFMQTNAIQIFEGDSVAFLIGVYRNSGSQPDLALALSSRSCRVALKRSRSMSINTHGTIHCKPMLSTRHLVYFRFLSWQGRHSTAGSIGPSGRLQTPLGIADDTDERPTDGTGSDHPAARDPLWRRVWVLPRRLLPSTRARWDRRHTRVGPGRPRDRVAGARAPRGPLSLSFERGSLVMA